MIKNCKTCGVAVDLTGLGSIAGFIEYCDPCADKHNDALDEKARKAHEDDAREQRAQFSRRQWEKVVPQKYRETDVNDARYPKGLHDVAKQWISGTIKGNPSRLWFGIVGISGKCKTRVMSQVVKNRISHGKACQWVNATQFQWCAQNQHDNVDGAKAKRHLESYRSCDFLAFDDLGKQKWTDTVEALFYDLIEHRDSRCLPMIWTSNSTLEELGLMLTRDRADAITGRLAETSNIIEL